MPCNNTMQPFTERYIYWQVHSENENKLLSPCIIINSLSVPQSNTHIGYSVYSSVKVERGRELIIDDDDETCRC